MRCRFAALLLFAVLPVMNVLAAPAPEPYGILDIGPPPKGETAEQYRKSQIDGLTCHPVLSMVWSDPEVRKLPSVTRFEEPRPWLAKNLHVTKEDNERRLRLTFQAGNRTEQVAILKSVLRIYLQGKDERIEFHEEWLRYDENTIVEREKLIESGGHQRDSVEFDRKLINDIRTNRIPARRAEIARYKQIAVIKWAR